jgi:hypothetical protein
MSTKEKLVIEIIDELKRKGVTEVKYAEIVEGGRDIEIKCQDGTTTNVETLDPETTDNIDTLFRLLEHLKKVPECEEGQEVSFQVNGLTLKYKFSA